MSEYVAESCRACGKRGGHDGEVRLYDVCLCPDCLQGLDKLQELETAYAAMTTACTDLERKLKTVQTERAFLRGELEGLKVGVDLYERKLRLSALGKTDDAYRVMIRAADDFRSLLEAFQKTLGDTKMTTSKGEANSDKLRFIRRHYEAALTHNDKGQLQATVTQLCYVVEELLKTLGELCTAPSSPPVVEGLFEELRFSPDLGSSYKNKVVVQLRLPSDDKVAVDMCTRMEYMADHSIPVRLCLWDEGNE